MKKRQSRLLLALLLMALFLFGLTACGSAVSSGDNGMTYSTSASSDSSYAGNDYYEPAAEEAEYWTADMPMADAREDSRSTLPDGVKMIYTASLELETREYDKAVNDIAALTRSLGGYFEDQSSYNYNANYRSSSYTVRVPAERFEEFLRQAGELFNVRSQSQSAEDVSEIYYDKESRLETAKIKLERLQDLLARAENMEDIITIESAISETEYQIENLSGELRRYDSLIGYSTVYVNLQETYEPTEQQAAPLTFGERMGRAFRNGLRSFRYSLEDLALWLAESWLPLVVLLAAAVLIVRFVRRGRRGGKLLRRKNKNAPAETAEENNQQ